MVTKVLDKLYHTNYTLSYIIKNLSGKRDLTEQAGLFFYLQRIFKRSHTDTIFQYTMVEQH